MKDHVLSLGRERAEIPEEEFLLLQELFGRDVGIRTTNPRDSEDHLENCRALEPRAVLIPSTTPIFSQAVNQGVPHLVYGAGRKGDLALYRLMQMYDFRYPYRTLIHGEFRK